MARRGVRRYYDPREIVLEEPNAEDDNGDEAEEVAPGQEEAEDPPEQGFVQDGNGQMLVVMGDGVEIRKHDVNAAAPAPPPLKPHKPDFKFVPMENNNWAEIQQYVEEQEARRKSNAKRRKTTQYGEDLGHLQSLVHGDEEEEEEDDDALEKQSNATLSTTGSHIELQQGEHTDWCFFCRYSQDPYEQEQDPRYMRLLQIIEDNYGKCTNVHLAQMVSRYYQENFKEKKRGRKHKWSLHSIIYHIERVNPTEYVKLHRTLRNLDTMKQILIDENTRMVYEGGGESLNSTSIKAYRELLRDELLVMREMREQRMRSSMH